MSGFNFNGINVKNHGDEKKWCRKWKYKIMT